MRTDKNKKSRGALSLAIPAKKSNGSYSDHYYNTLCVKSKRILKGGCNE